LACGPSKLGEVELDQQPIRNGKLPNLWGKSIVFGPNIQWVGKDRPSGLPGWKARLMVIYFALSPKIGSDHKVWAEWKLMLSQIFRPNK
jgi:hypothetical protein